MTLTRYISITAVGAALTNKLSDKAIMGRLYTGK
jgi:hypothetical protein